MCLKHSLTQKTKDEDPPHAKIASDVMSRLFSVGTHHLAVIYLSDNVSNVLKYIRSFFFFFN